ncbi:MAG: cyclic nucleotide-binding domain-containing protein [Proteobacteria bacterium]|nr:cyclic nucleotide-binding domain-containing protein [Pseudomonadota bacterium]
MSPDLNNLIKGIYLFSNLNDVEIAKISAICRRESFPRGKLIFSEGDPGDKLYLITKGSVRVSKKIRAGKEQVLATLQAGDFFGEMALIDEGGRSADAWTEDASELISISKNDFATLIFREKDIATSLLWNIIRTLSSRLRETDEKLKNLVEFKIGI